MPAVQFSIAPWELGREAEEACSQALQLRERFMPQVRELQGPGRGRTMLTPIPPSRAAAGAIAGCSTPPDPDCTPDVVAGPQGSGDPAHL